jgi:hypothetical protein
MGRPHFQFKLFGYFNTSGYEGLTELHYKTLGLLEPVYAFIIGTPRKL